MRNQRKRLERLLSELGVKYRTDTLADGRKVVEFSGATFFFDGKKFAGATSTASARRWTKRQANGEAVG